MVGHYEMHNYKPSKHFLKNAIKMKILQYLHQFIIFYLKKKFDDISTRHRFTKDTVVVTDVERRRGAFVNEVNAILSRKSKKKNHLLPPVILQLMRLRFPTDLDKDKPLKSATDVSLDDFVQWTKHVK
jgi:hypothetical protein